MHHGQTQRTTHAQIRRWHTRMIGVSCSVIPPPPADPHSGMIRDLLHACQSPYPTRYFFAKQMKHVNKLSVLCGNSVRVRSDFGGLRDESWRCLSNAHDRHRPCVLLSKNNVHDYVGYCSCLRLPGCSHHVPNTAKSSTAEHLKGNRTDPSAVLSSSLSCVYISCSGYASKTNSRCLLRETLN